VKRVTILDVAAAAGVSKSSVARILNGNATPADPADWNETTRAVHAAAAALGYRRDASASNLRLGRTGLVGIVVTHLVETVRAMFFEEMVRACRAVDRFAIAAGFDEGHGSADAAVEQLLRQGADGLILTTARDGDTLPDQLTTRGIPFALALRGDGRSPAALNDDDLGGYLATRHLLELGHRRIAVVGGPEGVSTVRGRIDGYRRAMAEARLPVDPALIVPATFGAASGAAAAETLMRQPDRPTAIYAVNDTTAIGVMSALTRMGLSIPGDVSLVGYSDIPIVQHLPVALTTVHVHYDHIARDAVALLFAEGQAAYPRLRLTPPSLVVRDSTGPVTR
jgi:LacI family transcriptional regulator